MCIWKQADRIWESHKTQSVRERWSQWPGPEDVGGECTDVDVGFWKEEGFNRRKRNCQRRESRSGTMTIFKLATVGTCCMWNIVLCASPGLSAIVLRQVVHYGLMNEQSEAQSYLPQTPQLSKYRDSLWIPWSDIPALLPTICATSQRTCRFCSWKLPSVPCWRFCSL